LPYSPDFASSDCHLFGLVTNHLGGKHFTDVEKVEMVALKWLRQQSEDFHAAGSSTMVKQWDKCINVSGR
jgi:hypothetical protein